MAQGVAHDVVNDLAKTIDILLYIWDQFILLLLNGDLFFRSGELEKGGHLLSEGGEINGR